ncbi:hypothetical protein AAKU67_003526 [Oxalobacteraceae bacterium GrIS 2.11]
MCHEGGDKTMAQAFNCASTYGLEVVLVAVNRYSSPARSVPNMLATYWPG